MIYKALRAVEKQFPSLVVAGCAYEILAIVSHGKVPTISKILNKNKWIFPVFCGALGVHVWHYEPPNA